MALPGGIVRDDQNALPMAVRRDKNNTTCAGMAPASGQLTDVETARNEQSTTIPSTRLRLEDLPNELLSHIIDSLDTECPSEVNWNQRPDTTLTQSKTLDLKTISRTSKHLRHLVLSRLFAHTRLDPSQSTPFLNFVHRNNLTNQITSLVAHLSGSCTHLHPAWWFRILITIPLTTFTILCPPYVFAELTHTSLVDTDSWVFNMPYHALRFRQDHPTLSSTSISSATASHLFTTRPWTHLSINESSSLKAYSQYEYFLRKTPSLLASLHHADPHLPFSTLLTTLHHFTYTAIFPFYNHVETILHSVRAMPKLTHLTFKLCPEPESTVIDDELKDALGHIDVNDAWMEFDTAYTLIAHTVIYLTPEAGGEAGQNSAETQLLGQGRLEEFRVDDVKMEGIRENLEEVISQRLQEWWVYAGGGVWRRKERTGQKVVQGKEVQLVGGLSDMALA
jgi:hypothetical protein